MSQNTMCRSGTCYILLALKLDLTSRIYSWSISVCMRILSLLRDAVSEVISTAWSWDITTIILPNMPDTRKWPLPITILTAPLPEPRAWWCATAIFTALTILFMTFNWPIRPNVYSENNYFDRGSHGGRGCRRISGRRRLYRQRQCTVFFRHKYKGSHNLMETGRKLWLHRSTGIRCSLMVPKSYRRPVFINHLSYGLKGSF